MAYPNNVKTEAERVSRNKRIYREMDQQLIPHGNGVYGERYLEDHEGDWYPNEIDFCFEG